MESLLRIIALTRKELLAVLKDNRARNALLLPPILQCLLFGYAATYDLNHVPYAVLDRSHSTESQQLLSRFDGTGLFERVASLRTQREVSDYVDELNGKLERWETIKKFVILPRDLTVEDGELTPSMKIRRKIVEKQHMDQLDDLYAD